MRNWREYEGCPRRPERNAIYATINRKGEIIINRHTFETLDRPEAAVLLFEPETFAIGVKPASPFTPNAFPLRPKGNCENRVLYSHPFCEDNKLKFDCTVRFREAAVEDGVLVLDLRKTVKATRKPRNTSRRP